MQKANATPTNKPKWQPRLTPNLDHKKPHATKFDVAAYFGVTTRTVDTWIAEGLPHYKRGYWVRFKISELEEYFRQGNAAPSN